MVPTCDAMEKQEKLRRDDLWEVLSPEKGTQDPSWSSLYCMVCGIVCFNMHTPGQPFSINTRNPKQQGYLTLKTVSQNLKRKKKLTAVCILLQLYKANAYLFT